MAQQSQLEISQLVDDRPIGSWLYGLMGLCAAVLAFDGYDTQAIGYVAPAIVKEFGASKAALAPVFSAGLAGLLIGSLVCSPLADRAGRRLVMIISMVWFAAGALATPFATSLDQMFIIRFLTGLGLGGVLPNAVALVAEYAPKRRRATMITIMFCGFSIGAAVGGGIASWIVPNLGWRTVFYIGGIGPLLLLPLLITKLPESLRLMIGRGDQRGKVVATLRRMGVTDVSPEQLVLREDEISRGFPVSELFAKGRAAATLLLWTAFFMNLVTLYFMTNWLPIITNDAGVTVSQAVLITAMFQLGGTVGAVSVGRLADAFTAKRVLAGGFAGAALLIALMGSVEKSFLVLALMSFGAGFCVVGSQIGANAFAGTFYPPAAHATGVGWALGIGRFGAVVGPLIGGLLLSLHLPTETLFFYSAIPSVCGCLAILAIIVPPYDPKGDRYPLAQVNPKERLA